MFKRIICFNVLIIFGMYCNAQTRVVKRVSKEEAKDEYIEIEAENFVEQYLTRDRAWYVMNDKKSKKIKPDPDKKHLDEASNGAYIEVLPETFTQKNTKQIFGVNFAKIQGTVAIVKYKVNFKSPGIFYVWVRGYCTSLEDNSIHVGMDGNWPDSGKAINFCNEQQNNWNWSSSLRNGSDNCSVERERAFVSVDKPGEHIVQFSMREDGFEFDKFVLVNLVDAKPK